MFAQMAQEHQEYIQTKVNPTLENLVTQVLLQRPENPVPFMIQWLAQQTKASPQMDSGEAEKLRGEIRTLTAECGELEAKIGPRTTEAAASAAAPAPAAAAEDDEDEEDDDDDAPDDFAPPPSYLQNKQRASVSAEAYGDWNKVTKFTPPVYEKTEEQKGRLSAILKICWLFSELDKANMDIIVDAMIEKEIPADNRIIQEGDDGACMYVIEKGSFECKKMISGEEKVVKTCAKGDFFGELALLYNCPRAASVEAREAAVLWELDRETFNAIVKEASMKKREKYENFLKGVALLQEVGNFERSALADSLHMETVAAGSVVISQGDSGDRFYLVESGALTATKDAGTRDVMKYKEGDYFGELALLKNEFRAATVVADSDCQLLWLDSKTFKSLLGSMEAIMQKKASADYVP